MNNIVFGNVLIYQILPNTAQKLTIFVGVGDSLFFLFVSVLYNYVIKVVSFNPFS